MARLTRGPGGRPLLTLALQYPVTMAPYPYLTLTLALTNQARDCSRASARAYLFVGPSLSPSSVEFSRALASRNQFTTPSYCSFLSAGGRTSPLRTHTVTPRPHLCFHVPGRVRDFDMIHSGTWSVQSTRFQYLHPIIYQFAKRTHTSVFTIRAVFSFGAKKRKGFFYVL